VIGFLGPGSAQSDASRVTGFRQGLSEAGLVEGRNFTIEYRWADSHYDRLPALATELVHRQVAVIATSSTPAVLAAKAATTTIPIVFETASNPVKLGLVASFNRPGGNITGVTQASVEIVPKRLELLHELLPRAGSLAFLVNPTVIIIQVFEARRMADCRALPLSGPGMVAVTSAWYCRRCSAGRPCPIIAQSARLTWLRLRRKD
jgi:putative tryptophan/tyrosine transport system substrate-binding protein